MSNPSREGLDYLFHPRSIALAGISVTDPNHWTRTFLDSLLDFKFTGPIYLVNPKGGNIGGLKVYRSLRDIPYTIDYVISTVPAQASPRLVEECADKGVKALHLCTAGFSETGEEEGARLEAELANVVRKKSTRVIGPNCMGIYCPESHLSFREDFPKESGPVGFVSQSGANAGDLITETMWRGVRFSKVISYGNACDLNENDFIEYLATDPNTEIIALYVEGVKDGRRFRKALERATKEKVVVLLKGGITEGGARATIGHTGVLAGKEIIWNSLCKQLRIIRAYSMQGLADILVTLLFMPPLKGRNAAIISYGGGTSVLITDAFETRGLNVPPLPEEIRRQIREFSQAAGNILINPIDYSQTIIEIEKLAKVVNIISSWEGIDFLIWHFRPNSAPPAIRRLIPQMLDSVSQVAKKNSKPMGIVLDTTGYPQQPKEVFHFIQECVSSQLPVYYSFTAAADAISLVLGHYESRLLKL